MKFLIFFLFVAVATAAQLNDGWKTQRERCIKKLGLTKEYVKESKNNIQRVREYIACLGRELGNLKADGTVDKEQTIKTTSPWTLPSVANGIANCCVEQAYNGKRLNRHTASTLFTDFVTCWLSKVPTEQQDLYPLLAEPRYPLLDTCPWWQKN